MNTRTSSTSTMASIFNNREASAELRRYGIEMDLFDYRSPGQFLTEFLTLPAVIEKLDELDERAYLDEINHYDVAEKVSPGVLQAMNLTAHVPAERTDYPLV